MTIRLIPYAIFLCLVVCPLSGSCANVGKLAPRPYSSFAPRVLCIGGWFKFVYTLPCERHEHRLLSSVPSSAPLGLLSEVPAQSLTQFAWPTPR
jgi:hypothetical protein